MYPASFEYHAAHSVDEAVALLVEHGSDAKLIAGGHSLVPLLKLRFAQPAHLVDIRRIPNLGGIREEGGTIVIGAATTHTQIERSDLLQRRLPIVAEAARQIGDPQVRNMGTIGGSLAHADPGADLPAVMLAVDASFRATGRLGARTIAARDFFVDVLTTALEPNEVLTEIRIPVGFRRSGGAYEKHRHPASGYALIGVAAFIALDGAQAIQEARIAVTGGGARAMRVEGAERALIGQAAEDSVIERAADRVGTGIEVRGDLQGSAAYKANLAVVHARRAIKRAVERASTV